MDYEKSYTEMQSAVEWLENEEIGVPFGSTEYKNATEFCKKVAGTLQQLKEKGADYKMSDYELQQVRQQMEEAANYMDVYLQKKNQESVRKGHLSATSSYRVEAMRSAKRKMEEQMNAVGAQMVERGLEEPLPSREEMEGRLFSKSESTRAMML